MLIHFLHPQMVSDLTSASSAPEKVASENAMFVFDTLRCRKPLVLFMSDGEGKVFHCFGFSRLSPSLALSLYQFSFSLTHSLSFLSIPLTVLVFILLGSSPY